VSGNPGGRPKGDATVKELAPAHTLAAIETLVAMLQPESERIRVAAAEALSVARLNVAVWFESNQV
jgi:hypothetical protein